MSETTTGSCLCGAVKLEGRGAPKLDVCHCGQCRRWHGGPALGVHFEAGVVITAGADMISWYKSSAWAERGFCRTCGSTLFYRLQAKPDDFYAQAGSFDLGDGLAVGEHIFVDEHPGYYAFKDDAPRLTGAELMARFQSEQNGDDT